jgi:hypothetical protein
MYSATRECAHMYIRVAHGEGPQSHTYLKPEA